MKLKLFLVILSLGVLVSFSLFAADIYVCAGKNGNGSMTNPYGTIANAMDMGFYAGDVIHVAEGVYYGKGGSGKWVIDKINITLVGGYNQDFSERNPWKYQTILIRGMGDGALSQATLRNHSSKWGLDLEFTTASYNGNALIQGSGEHDNAIVDGFIIDGYTRHMYKSNGDLKTDIGPIGSPLISFNRPGCKVRNCVLINSGGPGVYLVASGTTDDPDSWPEVSNNVIVNTLMRAIDFRVGDMDPDNAPDGGNALIKNNTIAFVWTLSGEGYGILIGRQTRLTIENNIIAFATDYGMNNGFGNNKAQLINNCFFNNMGGVYRYFDTNTSVTVVEDDPSLFTGRAARRMYYLSNKSEGNYTANPMLNVDPDFFDKFTNQIRSEGGGKVVWDEVNQWRSAMGLPLIGTSGTGKSNYAPVYEHEYMFLFSDAVDAGAKPDLSRLMTYTSVTSTVDKDYVDIDYSEIKDYLGRDVCVSVKMGSQDMSSFYIDGITRDDYYCYRSDDRNNFIYIKKGTEALEIIKECIADGINVILYGTVYDIYANIHSSGKYGFVVDEADYDE